MPTHKSARERIGEIIWHYSCEDTWYACPKSEEGAGKEGETECNCGRDSKITKILAQLAELVRQEKKNEAGNINWNLACEHIAQKLEGKE